MNIRTGTRSMTELAESFAILSGKPGVRPWDPAKLDKWASSVASTTECYAAAFVLEVYDLHGKWKCGPFQVVKAMAYWDSAQRKAFLSWAEKPWTA